MKHRLFFLIISIFIFNARVTAQVLSFGVRQDRGIISATELTEVSGLVSSRSNRGVLWVHNDSGSGNLIWAISAGNGQIITSVRLSGVQNRDWEDIASGPGPVDGVSYLYIGDIGDNRTKVKVKKILRFPEPGNPAGLSIIKSITKKPDIIRFMYPDGIFDAETILLDPVTRDLFIITKQQEFASVYMLKYPQSLKRINTAAKIGTIAVPLATGGSVSADGKGVLIKNYLSLFYWPRDTEKTLAETLRQQPVRLNYIPEPQGEAVGWESAGNGFFTISEQRAGMPVHLFYYPRN